MDMMEKWLMHKEEANRFEAVASSLSIYQLKKAGS